ncbi:MAG: SurA N-terminal domain-containing protein [Candidatus Roizmanbacteria bacterium]|nr:MAG: SurA N-terminal domain-containing protein [Candidatus Roizmanbacteria bacterium]
MVNKKKSLQKNNTPSPIIVKLEKLKPPKKYLPLVVLIIIAVLLGLLFYFKGLFIAAIVNGQPISRLEVIKELEKQGGQRTLESLITKNLILQEARKNKINISSKELDEEIKKIESQVSKQGQNLDQLMAAQGITRDLLKEQIRVQKIIEKILGNKITVTDKEVDDYIQNNKQSLPENLQGDELKKNIKQQLQQQKLSTAFQQWMEQARKDAKISTFVTY